MIKIKILCLDQATVKTGYSLFENKKLIKYGLLEVDKNEKNYIERMKLMIEKIKELTNNLKPDFIVFEGVQYQNNQLTYSQLSQLQGILMGYLFDIDLGFTIVKPTEWKSLCKIKGRKREEQKKNTQVFVKNKYDVDVSEDIADAIGIGTWAINKIKAK